MVKVAKRKNKNEHFQNIGVKLYLNKEQADVYFKFENETKIIRIPAHKTLLINGSSVFKAMFTGGLKENGDVEIKDVCLDVFKEFLQFFYLDEVEVTIQNVADVMYLAEKYDVTECMNVCEQFLLKQHLTELDILKAFELAIKFERLELKTFTEKQISEQAVTIFSYNIIKNCSKETLKIVLEIKNLNCEPKDIFDGCIYWAVHACIINGRDPSVENQRNELGECFNLIPFGLMDAIEISECITQHRGLFNRDELEDVIDMLSSNGSPRLQIFKPKSYFLQWNKDSVLKCSRVGSLSMRNHYLNQLEVASFNTKKRMLFGGISLAGIHDKSNSHNVQNYLRGVLTIIENDIIHLDSKILLVQPVKFALDLQKMLTTIEFTKELLIKSDKVYEVQILFDASWKYKKYFVNLPPYRPKVIFGENQQVNFQRNYNLSYDNLKYGIISEFHFNSLNNYTATSHQKWKKYLFIGGGFAIGFYLVFSKFLLIIISM